MLTKLELDSFKCFRKLVLPLAPLTLLSGRNASGKSTVIQSLVLLHQTAIEAEWSRELRLNGSLLALGTSGDLIDKVTGRRSFGIGIATDRSQLAWTFHSPERRAMRVPVESLRWSVEGGPPRIYEAAENDPAQQPLRHLLPVEWSQDSEEVARLAAILKGLQYIGAERIGPREIYPLTDASRRDIGARGQNAPALLHWFGDERITGPLVQPSVPPTLRRQVEAWMRIFFPGCGLDVQPVPNANQVSLGLRTDEESTYHRPQHVGFGLTHVLPIITAALAALPPQILLVENPEVHLHPAGQSLMGRFLAQMAAAGIQVIMETHSDHVLNGVRRAVRNRDLAAASVAIHFFNERSRIAAEGLSQVVSPRIDREGNLDHWPEGFFDQLDKDMDYFAGWGE